MMNDKVPFSILFPLPFVLFSLFSAVLHCPMILFFTEGQLVISVDLSPGANPAFRLAPPVTTGGPTNAASGGVPNYAGTAQRLLANRILRCIEKIIVLGGTLDLEALCLIPSEWIWRFNLALTVLDDGGNIMDASVMAAIAALRHYRKPHVDLLGDDDDDDDDDNNKQQSTAAVRPILIPSHLKEPTPLPLHHTPLSISFAFIPMEDGSTLSTSAAAAGTQTASGSGVVAALIDPTDREELMQAGSLTVGMNVHAEVCLLDYGGGCELPPTQFRACWNKASNCVRQLCTMLEESLEAADQQSQKDRLQKLQQQQPVIVLPPTSNSAILPPPPLGMASPLVLHSENPGADMEMMDVDDNAAERRRLETEAEEAYQRQILDYGQGHMASKVRDDKDHMQHSSQAYFNHQASSLMKKLLQTAPTSNDTSTTATTKNDASMDVSADAKEAPSAPTPSKKARQDSEAEKGSPAKASSKSNSTDKANVAAAGQLDSDEEESTELLQSEFQSSAPPAAEAKPTPKKQAMDVDDDDDIDDLAMAINKKKKKKKKTKK